MYIYKCTYRLGWRRVEWSAPFLCLSLSLVRPLALSLSLARSLSLSVCVHAQYICIYMIYKNVYTDVCTYSCTYSCIC